MCNIQLNYVSCTLLSCTQLSSATFFGASDQQRYIKANCDPENWLRDRWSRLAGPKYKNTKSWNAESYCAKIRK